MIGYQGITLHKIDLVNTSSNSALGILFFFFSFDQDTKLHLLLSIKLWEISN